MCNSAKQDAPGQAKLTPNDAERLFALFTYCVYVYDNAFERKDAFKCMVTASNCEDVYECLGVSGTCNSFTYRSSCDLDDTVYCDGGWIIHRACPSENPQCAVSQEGEAFCHAGDCAESESRDSCDADTLRTHVSGKVVLTDCSETGAACLEYEDDRQNMAYAACGVPGQADIYCDTYCEGNTLIHCVNGRARWSEDCSRWEPEATCLPRGDGGGALCTIPRDLAECDPEADWPFCVDEKRMRYCAYGKWRFVDCAAHGCGACGMPGDTGGVDWTLSKPLDASAFPPWLAISNRVAGCYSPDGNAGVTR